MVVDVNSNCVIFLTISLCDYKFRLGNSLELVGLLRELAFENLRYVCLPIHYLLSNNIFQNNYVDYLEDDEQVDVETIEELSEEINTAYKKTTTTHTYSFKQQ